MSTIQDKVALIAGGSSGIGLASARQFAAQGAQVVITGRHKQAVDDAVEQIGNGAIGLPGDVTDIAHHDRVAAEIVKRFGVLDIYMANARVDTIDHSPQVTEEEYEAQFSINPKGVFFGVQKMVPIMRNGGAIIITGSIASDTVMAGHAVHAGSKAAIFAFARSWAIELKARRIRVNVLSRGPVGTPLLGKRGIPVENRALFEQSVAESLPWGPLGPAR